MYVLHMRSSTTNSVSSIEAAKYSSIYRLQEVPLTYMLGSKGKL